MGTVGAPAMAASLLLGVVAFLYRFNALGGAFGGFGNDQFIHLARARQMVVAGELPVRDFSDPGAPLLSAASAVAQGIGGYTLLSEAVLTVGALAAGVALTVWLAARLTGRVWPGVVVGALQIVAAPRLYNYPKILLFALAVWLCWRYADRPSRTRLALLSACTTVAFLFRHDFLLYVAPLVAATVLLVHRGTRSAWSRLAAAGALALLFVSPFLVFVQASGGLTAYIREAAAFARADAARTSFEWPVLDTTLAGPIVSIAPRPPVPAARVNVQWAPTLSDDDRVLRERRYGLEAGEYRDGTTWNYRPGDGSEDTIEALVRDPMVVDTHGIDRTTYTVQQPPVESGWRTLPARLQFAPELTSEANAVAWLYYVLATLPALAAAVWVVRMRGSVSDTTVLRTRVAYVWPVILMSALLSFGFLTRGTIGARVADVSVPAGLLTAWLLCGGCERTSAASPLYALSKAAGLLVLAVSAWALCITGGLTSIVDRSKVLAPGLVMDRAADVWQELAVTPPRDALAPDAESPFARAARYVARCTPPDARLFVFGNLPEMYFFSSRLFAGGYAWLLPKYANSRAAQEEAIARLRAYDVPLVLTEEAAVYEAEYRPEFPALAAFVDARYREFGLLQVGEASTMRVHLRNGISWARRDEATGLPCAGTAAL